MQDRHISRRAWLKECRKCAFRLSSPPKWLTWTMGAVLSPSSRSMPSFLQKTWVPCTPFYCWFCVTENCWGLTFLHNIWYWSRLETGYQARNISAVLQQSLPMFPQQYQIYTQRTLRAPKQSGRPAVRTATAIYVFCSTGTMMVVVVNGICCLMIGKKLP